MLPAVHGMTWTWPIVDLEWPLRETASDQGPPCLLHLGCEVFAHSTVIFYSLFGTVQILIVLQGVHDMGLFCLDGRVLAGSVDLDRALQNTASDLGPPCLLLVWDVKYMQVVIYFSIIGPLQTLVVLHGVHNVTWVCWEFRLMVL